MTPLHTELVTDMLVNQMAAGLKPLGTLNYSTGLILVIIAGLTMAAGLIASIIVLSRPRRGGDENTSHGSHSTLTNKAVWQARINEIVNEFNAGSLQRDEAFSRLATVARDFASVGFHRNMSTHTLTDITSEPRATRDRHGLDLLKQTIAALYPPEFADERFNAAASQATVDEAAGWVATLIERWH